MSKLRRLVMTLVAGLAAATLSAADVAPYTCDFSKNIVTSNHAFKVASNWGHIPESYIDDYGDEYWMSYSYNTAGGVDDSAYLRCNEQYAEGSGWYDGQTVFDILVTPSVKGTVTIAVKGDRNSSYLEVYAINADGSRGDKLKSFDSSVVGSSSYSAEWKTITIAEDLADYQRFGLRGNYVGLDNLSATSADIIPEKSLFIESVVPTETTGTIYWNQGENGKVKINFKVKVKNDGEVDLVQGMEGYSITLFKASGNVDIATVPVPQDLAIGETSDEFDVSCEVEPTDIWENANYSVKINLRENISGSVIERASQGYKPYAPKFVFRLQGSENKYSISNPFSFGMITESVTKEFEIYNDGAAPLTIKSIVVPEGYTFTGPADNSVIEPGSSSPFALTLNTEQKGSHDGDLVVTYLNKDGADETYTLPLSGVVLSANAWKWDFGTSRDQYPAGSIANSGIGTDYNYSSGAYNYYLKGDSYNNDFILPLLHAEAGEELYFSTARNSYSSSNYSLQAYASKDRGVWGEEPLFTLTADDVTSTTFVSKKITLPEAGDWYIMFKINNGRIDDLAGLSLVDKPYDIYIKSVNSPDVKQKGEELNFPITTIATATLAAEDYTVQFIGNDEVLCTVESTALEANAKTEHIFDVVFTPEIESTTLFKTKARFTFTDGTVVESQEKDMKITYQPDFVFFDKDTFAGNYYKPDNRTKPISFGTTNITGASQEFEIYNWGAAPLTVSSITVPEGFSVTPQDATVASKERQLVTISVTAETPGLYEGNLEIKYIDADAAEQTFTLPISVNLLDTSKWYAEFGKDNTATEEWSIGTIHGKNVYITNAGQWDAPEMSIYCNSESDNMVISPRLHAEAGDILELCAKLYGTSESYKSGAVKIYTSSTRDGLKSDDTRTLVATLSGKDVEDAFLVTPEFGRFNVTMPETGDFYLGFELTGRLYVKYIYGLINLKDEHDLNIASSNIPAVAMQNVVKEMSVSVHNFGQTPEAADAYKVEAYVAGEKVAETAGTVEIPVNYSYEDSATPVVIPVRYPGVGTFPVSLRLTAGERVLETEPVDVTFAEETSSAEKQVGEKSSTMSDYAPLYLYDKNSEGVMVYTPELLGLENGDKISSLSMKGYMTDSKAPFTGDLKVYYKWIDETTIECPEAALYDTTDMVLALNNTGMTWEQFGSADESAELFTANFAEPLVYESGKSLMLLVGSYNQEQWVSSSNYSWDATDISGQCYYHSSDNNISTDAWAEAKLPVLYLSLAKESVVISGVVTDAGEPVEGAEVRAVSTDGDNVQYSALTDAAGAYSMPVIQNTRNYDLTVMKDGKGEYLDDQLFETSGVYDFAILDVVSVDNTVIGSHTASANAIVNLNLELQPGYNTLVLPFSLSSEEVAEIFGEDNELLVCNAAGISDDGTTVKVYFGHEEAGNGLVAGKPYIMKVSESPAPVRLRGKEVISEVSDVTSPDHIDFMGTFTAEPYDENIYIFNGEEFTAADGVADPEGMVMPYGAYVFLETPGVGRVLFVVDDSVKSEVSEIDAELLDGNEVIYNLQGIRVYNPGDGIYIVNGKKVLIKK